ncbi:MAG TPA: hypothetical protein VGE07_05120 [Herpetosiphonaceae bacterium]
MSLFLLFVIIVLPAGAQIIWALSWGWRAWRASTHMAAPLRRSFRFMALSLAEPLLNTISIPLLMFWVLGNAEAIMGNGSLLAGDGLQGEAVRELLAATWPMLLLLAPLFGLASANASARAINGRLIVLGIARWLVTCLTLLMPFALPLGMLLLWYCIAWARRQVSTPQEGGYQAIGLGSDGVLVDFAENMAAGGARINR